jgi:NhaP-type Na+/H+ or K+/H+ antiporter
MPLHFAAGTGLVELSAVLVLGIGAQWLAWRLHLPSILLLLLAGLLAGPVFGFLDPDRMLGDLLFPTVSVAVGLILFEGGLDLRLRELRSIGTVVVRLITLGALVTWALSAAAGAALLGLSLPLALLLGAVLTVTGPTVVLPLLRFVRPRGQVANVLKWEGIVIDPVGATLAVLVFEAILSGHFATAAGGAHALRGALVTLVAGAGLGAAGALLLLVLMGRHAIPDYLQETVTLMLVVAVFTGANLIQDEAGLLATTVMGVVLANQRKVTIHHILRFKENLGVLMLSAIFVLLAARIEREQLAMLGWEAVVFVLVLVVVVRPAAVFVSTVGKQFSWKEKLFLADMAPRGIVAAAVTSVFAYRLREAGVEGAEILIPVVFLVIVATAALYGLSSLPLARFLGLSQRDPQGVLLVGAHRWARDLARELKEAGFAVRLVDTNWQNIRAARMEGLPVWHGSILSHSALDDIDTTGLGRLLALTPNDEANSLSNLNFAEIFGRDNVYQLPPARLERDEENGEDFSPGHLRGRFLFAKRANFTALTRRFAEGGQIKRTSITEEFDREAFERLYGEEALPLFVVDPEGRLRVVTAGDRPVVRPGSTLVALVEEPPEERKPAAPS